MKQIIYHDENGREYVLDEMGNRIPPMKTQKIVEDGKTDGWVLYDSSQGHCALCGQLVCRGCVK